MIIIQSKESEHELEERILEILRQEKIAAEQFSFSSQYKLDTPALTIDGRIRQVFRSGREISLTRIEFQLLLFFAYNPGIVLSKEELFCAVWGRDSEDTIKVVANTISNLRKKLGDGSSNSACIRTVRGGYVFSVPEAGDF